MSVTGHYLQNTAGKQNWVVSGRIFVWSGWGKVLSCDSGCRIDPWHGRMKSLTTFFCNQQRCCGCNVPRSTHFAWSGWLHQGTWEWLEYSVFCENCKELRFNGRQLRTTLRAGGLSLGPTACIRANLDLNSHLQGGLGANSTYHPSPHRTVPKPLGYYKHWRRSSMLRD